MGDETKISEENLEFCQLLSTWLMHVNIILIIVMFMYSTILNKKKKNSELFFEKFITKTKNIFLEISYLLSNNINLKSRWLIYQLTIHCFLWRLIIVKFWLIICNRTL